MLIALCNMSGASAAFTVVDIFARENESEAYLQLNPSGTVPILTHGNFKVLGDSDSTYTYLIKKLPEVNSMFYNEEQASDAQAIFSHFLTKVRKTTRSMTKRIFNAKVFKKDQQPQRNDRL